MGFFVQQPLMSNIIWSGCWWYQHYLEWLLVVSTLFRVVVGGIFLGKMSASSPPFTRGNKNIAPPELPFSLKHIYWGFFLVNLFPS